MTDRELMQQALEALIWTTGSDDFGDGGKAREGALKLLFPCIAALRERLAREEQEPVATDWERIARVQNAKLMAMCDEAGGFEKLCEVMDKYKKTTPPQRTWVGLTDEEKSELDAEYGDDTLAHLDAIEAKLKEKNT